MRDSDDQRYDTIMGNVMEADSQDLGNVMTEDIGHQYVCILALTHVHGV